MTASPRRKTVKKSTRKAITQKTRFEVFKRDSFVCQYCGCSAPDVVLEVDHIKPVIEGGDNSIINLITACFDCNRGKGKRELSDNTEVTKQKEQLDLINERRNQMKLMMEWRQELMALDDEKIQIICEYIESVCDKYSVADFGRKNLKSWIKKFGLDEILISTELSFDRYFDKNDENVSWNKSFNYIVRIASVRKREVENPEIGKIFYIRGILRNRVYCNEIAAIHIMQTAVDAGVDLEIIEDIAKNCRHWTQWRDEVETLTENLENKDAA